MIDIGIKIKELRRENDITQLKLCQKIGIKQNTLSQFENNLGRPSYEILINIANYFKVTTDYLLGLEDNLGNKIDFDEDNNYKSTECLEYDGMKRLIKHTFKK